MTTRQTSHPYHMNSLTSLHSSQKVDIRHLNQEGASALALASLKGHLLCVRALLEADSSMCSVKDGIGRTPLNLAATAGHFKCLELLCQADRSQVNNSKRNWTIHLAYLFLSLFHFTGQVLQQLANSSSYNYTYVCSCHL